MPERRVTECNSSRGNVPGPVKLSARGPHASVAGPVFRRSPRARLDAAAELYLRRCYRLRTAARATEFAETLGLTQAHLSRMIARLAGTSAREYLRARQLRYAARVLRTTPLPIADVALASAFGTTSTFNRCFVAAFGKTPAAYRAAFRDRS